MSNTNQETQDRDFGLQAGVGVRMTMRDAREPKWKTCLCYFFISPIAFALCHYWTSNYLLLELIEKR